MQLIEPTQSEDFIYRAEKSLGNIESFNGKLKDGLINREVFYTFSEAKILAEQ